MESCLDIAIFILVICIFVGTIVGFLAGLLGIGGGLIIVPVLLALLPLTSISEHALMPMVLGTSLAAIFLTSIATLSTHRRLGNIPREILPFFAFGIGSGALIGSYFADMIPSYILQLFFACFVILMSVQMWLGAKKLQHVGGESSHSRLKLVSVSALIGTLSSLLGVGGGVMSVPYLTAIEKLDMRLAIGASACGGVVIALMGSLGYLWAGLHTSYTLPQWSIGYIYLPAFLGFITLSLFTAPIGVRVAKKMPVKLLKRCFSVLLFVVGTKILIG